jgi:hypothetical protein
VGVLLARVPGRASAVALPPVLRVCWRMPDVVVRLLETGHADVAGRLHSAQRRLWNEPGCGGARTAGSDRGDTAVEPIHSTPRGSPLAAGRPGSVWQTAAVTWNLRQIGSWGRSTSPSSPRTALARGRVQLRHGDPRVASACGVARSDDLGQSPTHLAGVNRVRAAGTCPHSGGSR